MAEGRTKNVIKNSLLLYIRMIMLMVISLITSRVVLRQLGASNYGLYNVIAGFISFFFVFSGTMSSAIVRFMTFEIGRGYPSTRKAVFTQSVLIFVFLSLVLLVIGLIIGIPFINNGLNIDEGREHIALVVFVWSLMAAVLFCVRTPFHASVIAYENFNAFALFSIIEAILKLLLLVLLFVVPLDKLVVYAFIQFLVTTSITVLFVLYSVGKYNDFSMRECRDKMLFVEIIKYSGWNFLQNLANICYLQGFNIVLNHFFGTIVNAARALSVQIQGMVSSFASNIQSASTPAITKAYAAGDVTETSKLYFQFSKYSFLMFAVVALPVMFVLPSLLNQWLGEGVYPAYTIVFTCLIIISSLINTLAGCSHFLIQATGKIIRYNIVYSFFQVLPVLFAIAAYYFVSDPVLGYYVIIFFSVIQALYLIWESCKKAGLLVSEYIKCVLLPSLSTCFFSTGFIMLIRLTLPSINNDVTKIIINGGLYLIVSILSVYIFGLSHTERKNMQGLILLKLNCLKKMRL